MDDHNCSSPKVSPDGAFIARRDEGSRAWYVASTSGSADPVAVPSGGERLSWSPAGATLLAADREGATLYDVAAGVILAAVRWSRGFPAEPVWSRDGSTVAVEVWSEATTCLHVLRASGAVTIPGASPFEPRLSADGSRLAWIDDGREYVASIDGVAVTDVVSVEVGLLFGAGREKR